MFTGIIETLGKVISIKKEKENVHFEINTTIFSELQIDQSIAHNGTCLTIVKLDKNKKTYTVTAIKETLEKTNLGLLKVGDIVNLERAMILNTRLDGHIVQGHVDQVGKCIKKYENDGSWTFVFSYKINKENVIVEKGSICINGISLTAFNVTNESFEVAIIPYTIENTNLIELISKETTKIINNFILSFGMLYIPHNKRDKIDKEFNFYFLEPEYIYNTLSFDELESRYMEIMEIEKIEDETFYAGENFFIHWLKSMESSSIANVHYKHGGKGIKNIEANNQLGAIISKLELLKGEG